MDQIDLSSVAEKYNSIKEIWNENDKWHLTTFRMINEFIQNSVTNITFNTDKIKILNLGSGGNNYNLDEAGMFHIDIAIKRIIKKDKLCVANSELLPIKNSQFDLIMCVGSVINYCDPVAVFAECSRVLKNNGYLIIEFENSNTMELIGTTDFNKSVVYIKTFYNGANENIWYFSEKYINSIAASAGFTLMGNNRCHIISPLIYRFVKNENFAGWFSKFDKLLLKIPYLNLFSSNTICLFAKNVD